MRILSKICISLSACMPVWLAVYLSLFLSLFPIRFIFFHLPELLTSLIGVQEGSHMKEIQAPHSNSFS